MWQQTKWLSVLTILAATPAAWGQNTAWRSKQDVAALARKIDGHIAAAQKAAGVVAAPPAEHGAFFRRLHLDLAGIVPTLYDVKDYLENEDPDKLWTKTEDYLRHKRLRTDSVALFQLHNQLGMAIGDRPQLSVQQLLRTGGRNLGSSSIGIDRSASQMKR